MRIRIAAIGKAKSGPSTALYEEYIRRLPWRVELKEIELKKPMDAARRRAEETRLLLEACHGMERIIALDEQGELLSSAAFAERLGDWQAHGAAALGIVIGGADGLDRAQLKPPTGTLSFGRLTWPHLLVRPMLAEQLYRAYTLLNNHPYHRE